ncbi:MAG: hypothetical protein V1891_02405 [bacterium]
MINSDKIYKIIKIFLIALPCFIFCYLACKNIVPWGSFNVEYDFSEKFHPFFSILKPEDRLGGIIKKEEENYQIIKSEPVYFNIETPRFFKNVEIEIDYKFPEWQNKDYDFKIGILADEKSWQFKLKPIENSKIEQLIGDWDTIREGNIILMQSVKTYNSINEFLSHLPERKKFATYAYSLSRDFALNKYNPKDGYLTIDRTLKGYHQFYTYVKNEPLEFNFSFSGIDDLNFCASADVRASISVYQGKDLILNKELCEENKFLNGAAIYKENLKEGVYKIEIKIADNIYINKINTKQDFLSFINKINLANNSDDFKPISIYTDSESLKFAASVNESLQHIKVGDKIFNVDELFKQFDIAGYSFENFEISEQKNSLAEINFSRDNILIQGAGVFSFSKESFINPSIIYLENIKKFDDLRYVIAEYKIPEVLKNGWKTSKVSFALNDALRDKRKYNFILSIPGVEELYIKKINAKFSDYAIDK